MRKILSELEEKENLEISLEVLESEMDKKSPRIPVIKGMLSNFNHIKALRFLEKKSPITTRLNNFTSTFHYERLFCS